MKKLEVYLTDDEGNTYTTVATFESQMPFEMFEMIMQELVIILKEFLEKKKKLNRYFDINFKII